MPGGEDLGRDQGQAADDQRRAIADEVIVNDGTLEELNAATDALFERLRSRLRPA